MTYSHVDDRTPLWALPDPATQPDFYAGVPAKRLFAWIVDVILITVLTAIFVPFTLFTALFYLPVLYAVVSFLYRWVGLSRRSATVGMRLMSLEMRRADGSPFDTTTALLHTAGYVVSVVTFPLQLISIAMMLVTSRRQGLTDMILGTAALNRVA